ncbi:MAG TPA: cadherin-like domain-containing protein [Pyrinomonadaceae bacterium]|nr:cadherin-like domain-containing protein [Pyrinomonadaceae bacterium]
MPLYPRQLIRLFVMAALASLALLSGPQALAVEIQVEVLFDSLAQPPAPLSNVCTLRKAVNNASDNLATYPQCQAGEGGGVVDTIVFLVPGTITFSLGGPPEDGGESGDLDVTDDLTIIGHPDGTTIDAADLGRVFHVHPGVTLTLINIHITNGNENAGGGGIYVSNATLDLDGVTVSSSHTSAGDGGGIFADNSTLNITNSTITGNTTPNHGAGIAVTGGTTNITNSTVTANHNQTGLAGGIYASGTVNLRSSILAGNTNDSIVDTSPNISGNITSLGYNVIGSLGTPPNNAIYVAQPTDQVGVTDAQLNLGPLQNNGGPTPTHALLSGSVAIDKGHSSGSTTDQRGLTRPCDLASVTNAAGGDGGDAGAFELQGACAGTNQPPNAVDDAATVAEDSGPNAVDVLANDTDPDADALSVTAVTQGANGSVSITGGGTGVSYTPNPNFFGADSFTYTISDGNSGADTATVNVSVTAVQDAPVANDDAATVAEDSVGNTINVLANDADADGETLAIVSVTQGASGAVENNGTSVSYTPNLDFFGSDSFTYTVTDGNGNFATATVNVTVANVNDAPVANDDSYSMNQDTTLNVAAPGVLGNDMDADPGDTLSSTVVTFPANGTLAPNADGSFMYTPNPGFTGVDTFTYKADDGTAESNVATVTVTVADTQGPNLTSSVAVTTLWQPNHNLVNVGLTASAADNSGDPVSIQVQVFSDEDDLTPASPDHSPDAKDIAPGTLRLRAERDDPGDGRVYLIVITATDSSNNVSRNYLTVVVPKSQNQANKNAVNQQAQAALSYATTNGTPPAGYVPVGDGPVVGPKQ